MHFPAAWRISYRVSKWPLSWCSWVKAHIHIACQDVCSKEISSFEIATELIAVARYDYISCRIISVGLRKIFIASYTFIVQSTCSTRHYVSLKTLQQNPAPTYTETYSVMSYTSTFFSSDHHSFFSLTAVSFLYIHLVSRTIFIRGQLRIQTK
jgi:hypothetical protein